VLPLHGSSSLRKGPPETGKSGIGNVLYILRKFRVTYARKKGRKKENTNP
jgi:hypothetical protein